MLVRAVNFIAVVIVGCLLALPHVALGESGSIWDAADAASLNQQVNELSKQGRYSEALPVAQKALALREKALGPDNADVALSLYTLATLYQKLMRYADAEPLFKRNLAILEKLFGPDNANVATSLNNLAALYKLQSRYADAEALYKRSVAIWEKVRLDDLNFAITLSNFADLYGAQARYAEAEPLYKRSLAKYIYASAWRFLSRTMKQASIAPHDSKSKYYSQNVAQKAR